MNATTAARAQTTNSDRDSVLAFIRPLVPMRYLSNDEFAIITSSTEVETCATERDLFASGKDDPFIYYVLSGELKVADDNGKSFKLKGGSTEARNPLSPHRRDRTHATALSPVKYVRFPADLMNLHGKNAEAPVMVQEINSDDDVIDNQVLFDVYHSVMNDDLVLPSLPDVAMKIRETANDDNAAVEDIAKIIQADASTTAYCISVANSAAHGGVSQVDNVLDAVVRLGMGPTRDIIVAYTMRSLFAGTSSASKKLMREAWQHSCRIAALSYILAREVGRLNPERAMLAGLLHDIGVTVLIKESQDHPVLIDDPIAFDRLCHELSGQIGAMILRAWKFPEVFINATLEAEMFDKPAPADRLQLTDVVMLAHIHDNHPAPWSLPSKDIADLSIHSMLKAYEITDDSRLAIVEETDQELAELTQLLGG